ncbi:hypothetical protein AAVH_26330 [Aphelenchoides avenae]|nr:hypothetical protein AAVH_26330 [Aphelenchus avenae]
MFLRRIKLLSENASYAQIRFKQATAQSIDRAHQVELRVLKDYLTSADDVWNYLRDDVTLDYLSVRFFVIWYFLENALTTLRNQGQHRNAIFMVDETVYNTSPEALEQHLSHWPVCNVAMLARQGSEKLNQALPFVESIQRKRLDEVELSAITMLLLARYEANLFLGEDERRKFTDVIIRDLSSHYDNSSKEFTTAFDRITSFIAEFHECLHSFSEWLTMHDIHLPQKLPANFVLLQSFRLRKQAEPSRDD